jgi:phenylacetate-CoA ligase
VNIYPGQIDHVLSHSQGIDSDYQIILEREGGKDYMTIKVERSREGSAADDAGVSQAIAKRIKREILVSARVEVVDYGSLPRTDRKSKRVFDNRFEE